MKIVADTNTFLAVALKEPEKAKIIQLTKGHDLVAPEVLPFEIGNALSAMLKKHTLNTSQVTSIWNTVQTIPVEYFRVDILAALELAAKCNIYAYDAYFLECAIRLRCPLLTLDRRLKVVAENNDVKIQE
jgi:predicted nucleic acid-binding protein